MRVAFVLDSISRRSSIGRIVLNLARIFKKEGHEIKIFTIDYDLNFIEWYGIKEDEIKNYRKLQYLSRMSKIPILGYIIQTYKYILFGFLIIQHISKYNPDILNSHYYLCGISGYIVSKTLRIPHVLTFHGIHLSKAHLSTLLFWTNYLITNQLKKLISHFISVDPSSKSTMDLEEIKGRLKIIYPCLDAQFIQLSNKINQDYKSDNELKLMYVGRLEKQKGLKDLLIELSKGKSSWSKLSLTSSGYYEKKLRSLSKRLNISSKVVFTGFLGEIDKIKLINDSDIFISYSKSEGFPLIILECFYFGKPCIIFPISPFADETGNLNELGFKFKSENLGIFLKSQPKFLIEILTSLNISQLFSPETCIARKNFVKRFYPEEIAKGYLEHFVEIIKKCSNP